MTRLGCLGLLALCLLASMAEAHGVADRDQGFLAGATGLHLIPYAYLGAKHMVTGYDHLLYLAGVIFYLTRPRDVFAFVSLFALGHSLTLMIGVLSGWHVNAMAVDAIIGLSVAYKALENLNVIHFAPPRVAVFGFGLVHGLGLSSKLQDITLSPDGLVANMIAFNIGVEIGQVLALVVLLTVFDALRRLPRYDAIAINANVVLFGAGLLLFGLHAVGFLIS